MHCAIQSIDHLSSYLSLYGKGSHLENLKLHRRKCSSIIKYVVGPCVLENLMNDLKDMPFSLILDESTDVSTKKYLCICIKYYSKLKEKIITTFLSIIEIEIATADELHNILKKHLENLGLNINELVGIGTDSANNLSGKNHSLFTKLIEKNK
jgi:hypothetical protein